MKRQQPRRDARAMTTYSDLDAPSCGCQGDPQGHAQGEFADASTDVLPDPSESDRAPWEGVIALEEVMTGDGRMFEENALRWGTLPIPLRDVESDAGAHDGAQVTGLIETLERRPREGGGSEIFATGFIDIGSERGQEVRRLLENGLKGGISVDLDDMSYEVRIAQDLLAEMEEMWEPDAEAGLAKEEPATDSEGRVTVMDIDANSEVMVVDDARIRAATLVDTPAFEEVRIHLTGTAPEGEEGADEDTAEDSESTEEDTGTDRAALVASAIPMVPPAEWFEDPALPSATPLTVTEEGRVFGHLAAWGTCHVGFTGQCIEPPRNYSGYQYFHLGSTAVERPDGSTGEIATGKITLGTGHAGNRDSAASAMSHYENTGTVVADIVTEEDAHGIWFSGALRPGVTAAQIRELRAAPLSGDWREMAGSLELVAALAVNVPGYPIPHAAGLVASGRMKSLVAAGALREDAETRAARSIGDSIGLTAAEVTELREDLRRRRESRKVRADDLARLATASRQRAQVRMFVAKRKAGK